MDRLEVHRLAMVAPPSRGSAAARLLGEFAPARWIAGPSAVQATPEEVARVPPPSCRFGIIAGGRADGRGYNPWISGDDDGLLSVEETRLDGAEDFLVAPAEHTFIPGNPQVIEATLSYLATGRFQSG
jgi:hypothetical protein